MLPTDDWRLIRLDIMPGETTQGEAVAAALALRESGAMQVIAWDEDAMQPLPLWLVPVASLIAAGQAVPGLDENVVESLYERDV